MYNFPLCYVFPDQKPCFMKISLLVFFVIVFSLNSCKKDETITDKTPVAAQGKWIRGIFDLSSFWTYTGTSIIHASFTTDGLVFHADGMVESYTVFFPTNPNQGCTPQKLMYKKGMADFNEQTHEFTLTFTEGKYREFYQSCTGKTNREVVLTKTELDQMKLSGFWKVEAGSGKKIFGISYVSVSGPYLYLEESNW